MECDQPTPASGGDSLEGAPGGRPFDFSPTAWLVGESIGYLNGTGKEAELAYEHGRELLRRCDDAGETLIQLLRQCGSGDAPLRWNLLYVLGDVGDPTAGEFLVELVLEPCPKKDRDDGCESSYDMELLVRTMAVHALRSIAERDPEASDHLVGLVSETPERAILIEAVKAATSLGLEDRVRDALDEDDRWILDIRHARATELTAEPEREDGTERSFTPPRMRTDHDKPRVVPCGQKEC